jgi:hypothetical protein
MAVAQAMALALVMAVAVVPYETTYFFINFFRIFDFP